MLRAEAKVHTERASGDLIRACQHFSANARRLIGLAETNDGDQTAPGPARVCYTDTYASLDFGYAQASMHATPTALILRAQARDHENLQHMQAMLSFHLQMFCTGEDFAITWLPAHS